MRIAALVIVLWVSTALAGPDGIYYALENRIEKGEIVTVGVLQRIKIGGVGQLEGLLARATRPPRAAQWIFDPNLKDWVLVDQMGHSFAPKRARQLYLEALKAGQDEFVLPVTHTLSSRGAQYYYKQGIRQLLAEATTYFGGSSSERRFNIALVAKRLNGDVIAPGEIFSFAKVMGEVSERTGFKKAFVISRGQTVEGVGGGIC